MGGSAGKESACNAGDLGSVAGLGKPPAEGKGYPLLFWPGEFHGLYCPWGCKESDTTEGLKKREPFLGHKFDNPDEMNQLFQRLNLPKFTRNINRPIISLKMIK